MNTLAVIIAAVVAVSGLILVPFGLPGIWLIVLSGIVYSIFYPMADGESAWKVNAILILLALGGEAIEFGIGAFGGKAFRVSTGAIVSAFFGGIIGAIVGVPVFLIGSLLGLFLGAFLGAFLYEWATGKTFAKALSAGTAVLFSRVVAAFLKTGVGAVMLVYFFFKLF